MLRIATTLIALGLALSACKAYNAEYCAAGNNADDPRCRGDATIGFGPCSSNTQCASPNPVCDDSIHACVQCLGAGEVAVCTGVTPICDNRVCRGCSAHSDCGSQACLPNGMCAPEGAVAYVDSGGTDNTQCTRATPCPGIERGFETGRSFVKLHGSFDEGVNINRSITILADSGARLTRTSLGPVLQVNNPVTVEIDDLLIERSVNSNDAGIQANSDTTLTLNRVTVSGAAGNGITCLGRSLTIRRSTIAGSALIGVSCSSGSLVITASSIHDNAGGGVVVTSGAFDITNSIIAHNGSLTSPFGGASLSPPIASGNRFEFNTVAENHIRDSTVSSGGVVCDFTGLALPNNIVAHNDVAGDPGKINSNTFGACTYPTSTISPSVTELRFLNPNTGAFRLTAGSTAIDQALTPSTIDVDIDGDPRPQGASKDQGADEYRP